MIELRMPTSGRDRSSACSCTVTETAALVQASLRGRNMSNVRSALLTATLINIKFVRHITPYTLALSSPTFLTKFSAFLHGGRALTTAGGRKSVRNVGKYLLVAKRHFPDELAFHVSTGYCNYCITKCSVSKTKDEIVILRRYLR